MAISKLSTSASLKQVMDKFEATNVEDALLENKTSILNLQSELGTNKATLQNNINAIREVL